MKCPKCGYEQNKGEMCQKCGIYFHKYERAQQRKRVQNKLEEVGLLWQMKEADNPLYRAGRLLVFLGLVWLSWSLIFSPVDFWQGNVASRSFLHNINLPFHEFGHLMFRAFGSLMHSLGGSMGQLLMPLVCFFVLLWQTGDAFGAAVCLWWLGESLLDLAPYIHDALHLSMPLLGGNEGSSSPYGFHDWKFILTETGLIQNAENIAHFIHVAGSVVMSLALFWMLLLMIKRN